MSLLTISILKMYGKPIFISALMLLSLFCRGQHVEYDFGIGSGLFHYVSDNNDKLEPFYSMINTTFAQGYPPNTYANNPKGEKSGFSFQVSAGLKKITKHNFVLGLDLEFESLQSKKKFDYVYDAIYDTLYDATGQCTLRNKYFTLSPYFGKRIIISKIYLDITAGFELALNFFNPHENDNAVITSTHQIVLADIISRQSSGFRPFDTRARLRAQFGYKKFGVSLGYSLGLTNMDGTGQPNHCHTSYLYTGIFYTIGKK
jgi:outer membrane protein with beta-barrel domain